MALAQSMKDFVNDVKASRRSRHGFVKGNREIAKNIMADNRRFLQNIRTQNKVNAEQTHAFLKSAKETRMENYKKSQESIKATLTRIHQAKEAITQGAHEMVKEFREDAQMAHQYWASLATDEPIAEPKAVIVGKNAKKAEIKPEVEKREVNAEAKKETEKNQKESG
jgi:CHAD domain-containing protein